MAAREPLSGVLPPLVLGTATFNTQYHPDPAAMPYAAIVRRALELGVAAFDTSPYYGPSERLLGDALRSLEPPPPREGYFLVTKAGRVAAAEFDYSPAWIRYSVCRSLDRLATPFLDLVYAHDVEFVSPDEVLAAVGELRRLRDEGRIRYVGISGYPVDVLASLAATVLERTGEPLDAVMSYGHFTLQNATLGRADLLRRFREARVGCVLNASMLGMGLLTTRGVDDGPMATWHPAPPALRRACHDLAAVAAARGERLEEVAIRWSLDGWARAGEPFGTTAYPAAALSDAAVGGDERPARIGVSVMGVSAVEELEETWRLWTSAVGLAAAPRRDDIAALVRDVMRPSLGAWKDYSWESGGEAFVNTRQVHGAVPHDDVAEKWALLSTEAVDGSESQHSPRAIRCLDSHSGLKSGKGRSAKQASKQLVDQDFVGLPAVHRGSSVMAMPWSINPKTVLPCPCRERGPRQPIRHDQSSASWGHLPSVTGDISEISMEWGAFASSQRPSSYSDILTFRSCNSTVPRGIFCLQTSSFPDMKA
ncbi:hypothetical protein RJ55_07513 [Drechmeria coniospora]|nr:hypothetical protein RJ55_07513 [Drechmeria coniospora]